MNLLSLERWFRSRDSLFKSSSFWTVESQVLELMPSPPTRRELLRREMWLDFNDQRQFDVPGIQFMLVNYIVLLLTRLTPCTLSVDPTNVTKDIDKDDK